MRSFAVFLAVCAGAGVLAADEVVLKNGDKLTGTVLSLSGGSLNFKTDAAGVLKIDWSQVASITSEAPVRVLLSGGRELNGKLATSQDGKLQVEGQGEALELAAVSHFNKPPVAWHGNVNFSARATDGNTHTTSMLVSAEGTRTKDDDEVLLRAVFRYGEKSGVLQERNSYGMGKYSRTIRDDLYGYFSEELTSDKFKDLSLGTVTSVGVGYQIVKEADLEASAEAGVAYFDNDFRELQEDESHMGARVSLKGRAALPLGFELKELFTIYPNFEDSEDWQFRNEATVGTALGEGWTLLGGVITEFDHEPSPGNRRHDDTYFVGLGLTF